MSKFALVIANTEYQDPSFAKLTAPGKDAEEFAQVLRELAGFDVQIMLNEAENQTSRVIARFFANRKQNDLLLLYFSGHGIRNEQGQLFLATTDTEMNILEASSIAAEFVTQSMNQSHSQRQVLVLDCCNSGAFAQGMKSAPAVGGSMGMATAFEGSGFGRVVLTATDATQYAWEGDKLIGNTQKSVFTHFLIEGLKGRADRNQDGRINVDELYEYAYEQVVQITPKQTPRKWSYRQQGEIILSENLKLRDGMAASLPIEPNKSIERPLRVFLCHSSTDKAAVQELYQKLNAEGWIDPWLDKEKLLPGQDWDVEIEKAVEAADVVVVCLSNRSVDKEGYVQKELRSVLNIADEKPEGSIFVIPLRLDACIVPRRLREWQWVDYFPDHQKSSAYERLVKSLKVRARKSDEFARTSAIPQPTVQDSKIKADVLRPKVVSVPGMASLRSLPYRRIGYIAGALLAITLCLWGGTRLWNNMLVVSKFTPTATFKPTENQISQPIQTLSSPEVTPAPITATTTAEPLMTGQDGMLLLFVPAGDFNMGSNGDFDEMPIHTVFLDAYWIDRTEVTNAMYAECVDSRACRAPVANTSITRYRDGQYYFGSPEYDDYPVIYVSWEDAKDYCTWVGRRLPTEAEWEKVAHWNESIKSNRKYPWGQKIDCSYANYRNGNNLCIGDTAPVGSYPSGVSYYGALDMAGNVWEWVFDRYDPGYYSKEIFVANPSGPLSGNFMVVRGGSFLTGEEIGNRSADRSKEKPDFTSQSIGFRCAMDVTP